MKKLFYLLFIITLSSSLFSSCTNETSISEKTLNVKDFTQFGKIHNEYLSNMKEIFISEQPIFSNIDEKVTYINKVNLSYTNKVYLPNSIDKGTLENSLNNSKRFITTENLTSELFRSTTKSNVKSYSINKVTHKTDINIFEIIQIIKDENIISDFGADLLNTFSQNIEDNYNGILSDYELKQNLKIIIKSFDNHLYQSDSNEGALIGEVLNISLSSIEWWEQNTEEFGNPSNVRNMQKAPQLLPWVAADLGGAVGGALGSILDNAFNGESINWRSAGAWAVGGAVGSSTGVWLLKFVK